MGIRFATLIGRGCGVGTEEDGERDASTLNRPSYPRAPLQSLEDSVELEITIVGGRTSKLDCCGGGAGNGGGGAAELPAPVDAPEDGGTNGKTGSLRGTGGASRNNGPEPAGPAIDRRLLSPCPAPTSSMTMRELELVLILESDPCPRNDGASKNNDPNPEPDPRPAIGRRPFGPASSTTMLVLELELMLESDPDPRSDRNAKGRALELSVPPNAAPVVGRDEGNPG